MELPVWFEITSLTVLTVILVLDLLLIIKRPHIPSTRESALWVTFYVSLALVFALIILLMGAPTLAGYFISGWALEYSLSIDNLFVFVLIMTRFAVPRQYQQKVLMIGIIIALVLRGLFILAGVVLVEQLSWIFYIFGAFLIWTAWRQAFGGGDDHENGEAKEGFAIRFARRRLNVADEYDGSKLRTVVNGQRMFTPMIVVLIAIGFTDLVFALDSIPAIFGITTNPFIIFTANIFALMGLRQLYFLLGDLLDRLKYLHYGIAFILAFIGVKLVMHALHANELPFINGGEHIEWVPDIPNWLSLTVILVSMSIATIASLIASARERARTLAEAAATPVVADPPPSATDAERQDARARAAAEEVAAEQGTPPTVPAPPEQDEGH